ncbi:hypothetical protein GLS40_15175 [Pseudooceanicola sp. 216_PA32_1]|uniref:Reverse transcriptase domain-containing protein n=1 Tax=Pseudooceanicola pacificus TaxID=2676438 RepID=A0A844WFR5_9RHOB|nr:antiviral reverse transcriptase Drt3a [Pseudooceanicola pacificus]MWB79380.1 hypothetical protein [Pseudooceanicola pacificus]
MQFTLKRSLKCGLTERDGKLGFRIRNCMQISPFKRSALEACIRVGDSSRYGVDLEADKDAIFDELYQELEDRSLDFPHKEIPISRGRKLHYLQDYKSVLALRATARNLNKNYGIRPANRNAIVRGVLEALFDATPSYVVRCDIASFFECLNAEPILDELHRSTKLHPHIRVVLERLQDSGLLKAGTAGVPRGLGLSSTFAEMCLRSFDHEVRLHPKVYRYFRFADDILIFSLGEPQEILQGVEQLLRPDFQLRRDKSYPIPLLSLPDTIENPCTEEPGSFSYLGYKFTCQHGIKTRKSRRVLVGISDNKINDRKTRVILSLKALEKNKDGPLFLNRIRILTSNYEVRKSRHTHGQRKAKVRTGIYYNYRLSGEYDHGKNGPHKKLVDPAELKELDAFLSSLLWASTSEYSSIVDKFLNADQKEELRRLSFYKGFTKKITLRLQRSTVAAARKAWRYA